jgi:hypothetical protein
VTADLRHAVDAVTAHIGHCHHDRTDLIDALQATVEHAVTCHHVDRDLLIDLVGRAERTRLHLVIHEGYPHLAETTENTRRSRSAGNTDGP